MTIVVALQLVLEYTSKAEAKAVEEMTSEKEIKRRRGGGGGGFGDREYSGSERGRLDGGNRCRRRASFWLWHSGFLHGACGYGGSAFGFRVYGIRERRLERGWRK
ncbi:unnamed protein product [Linum trigynum]